MIRLLFSVILSEMALILLFLFNINTQQRDRLVMSLDKLDRGRGPVVVKTMAGTVSVMLLSSVYNLMKMKQSSVEEDGLSPTDQVLMARHLLESTLIGAFLFLALMIDRIHHGIRDFCLQKKEVEDLKLQNLIFSLEEEANTLQRKLNQLNCEFGIREKEIATAKTNIGALRKQSEGFHLEYNRLLEENKKLRIQLQKLDLRTSRSIHKKNL